MICVAGSTVMVIHAPEDEKVATVVEMAAKMKDTGRLQGPVSWQALGDEPQGRPSCVLTMPGAATRRRRKPMKERWGAGPRVSSQASQPAVY